VKIALRSALALAAFALAAACTTGPGGSPSVSVPASLATAASSGIDAFCAADLGTLVQLKAAVDQAEEAAAGRQVGAADVATTTDAAVTELRGINATGTNATVRDAMITALQAFKGTGADPNQAQGQAVVTAYAAMTAAQDACPSPS
jgi:hypothetical protein